MKKFFDTGAGNGGKGGDKANAGTKTEEKSPVEKMPLKPGDTKPTKQHGTTEDVIVLRAGEVYIVPLNDKGEELTGQGFVTNEKTAAKHYSNPKKFVTKKKA